MTLSRFMYLGIPFLPLGANLYVLYISLTRRPSATGIQTHLPSVASLLVELLGLYVDVRFVIASPEQILRYKVSAVIGS